MNVMAEFLKNETNRLFLDLTQAFTDPNIRISKEDDSTIIIRIGRIVKWRLASEKGRWHLIPNDLG